MCLYDCCSFHYCVVIPSKISFYQLAYAHNRVMFIGRLEFEQETKRHHHSTDQETYIVTFFFDNDDFYNTNDETITKSFMVYVFS